MITATVLANTSITSHNYYFFLLGGEDIYDTVSLDFEAYHTGLLTITMMLYIRSPDSFIL